MDVTENEAKLVAIFVQSCLWGAFVVMFVLTYWTLVYRRTRGQPLNKPMFIAAIVMFVLATTQLAINFTRIIRGFVVHQGHTEEYYNVLAEFTQIFGSTLYILQTFVGDAVAIYRCYIVWSKRLLFILFPFATYLASLVGGIGILVTMGNASDGSLVFIDLLDRWSKAFIVFTLTTSTTCTIMIASRIWYLNAQSARYNSHMSSLHPVARIVVESGAIYSSLLVVLLILYSRKSWLEYVFIDALSPIIGIVFSVIIVRIGLGISIDPDTVQGSAAVHVKTMGGGAAGGGSSANELSTFEASAGLSSEVSGHLFNDNLKKPEVERSNDFSGHLKSEKNQLPVV